MYMCTCVCYSRASKRQMFDESFGENEDSIRKKANKGINNVMTKL